jgi:Zn-dependent peptidase ImmA (M78 family)
VKDVIRKLRDVVPIRPLSMQEAMQIAELQANLLLSGMRVTLPPVPETIISELPRIDVERIRPCPVSGAAHWSKGRWQIVVNGDESPARQRYSIAHEFKHVLDDPFIKVLYPDLVGIGSQERAEQVCDYFAACLLMPAHWMRHFYFDLGIHDPRRLAQRFETSWTAVQVRLLQIGLMAVNPSSFQSETTT